MFCFFEVFLLFYKVVDYSQQFFVVYFIVYFWFGEFFGVESNWVEFVIVFFLGYYFIQGEVRCICFQDCQFCWVEVSEDGSSGEGFFEFVKCYFYGLYLFLLMYVEFQGCCESLGNSREFFNKVLIEVGEVDEGLGGFKCGRFFLV